jgi:hypothetical protein
MLNYLKIKIFLVVFLSMVFSGICIDTTYTSVPFDQTEERPKTKT